MPEGVGFCFCVCRSQAWNAGVIENFDFVQAMWTVWFGGKPANGGLKKALLAELGD